eukprot:6337865-Prymnesium_polylepis.1
MPSKYIPKKIRDLLLRLESEREMDRVCAIRGLANWDGEGKLEPTHAARVMQFLDDDSERVRHAAKDALGAALPLENLPAKLVEDIATKLAYCLTSTDILGRCTAGGFFLKLMPIAPEVVADHVQQLIHTLWGFPGDGKKNTKKKLGELVLSMDYSSSAITFMVAISKALHFEKQDPEALEVAVQLLVRILADPAADTQAVCRADLLEGLDHVVAHWPEHRYCEPDLEILMDEARRLLRAPQLSAAEAAAEQAAAEQAKMARDRKAKVAHAAWEQEKKRRD